MEDESTIRTTAAMVYARGGAGRKASNGSGGKASKACGGSLEDCVAACPSEVPRVFTVCVATCGKRCGEK